jgi:hypothetical protein
MKQADKKRSYKQASLALVATLLHLSPETADAQSKPSFVVPIFEVYHSDNLNGATTSTEVMSNGVLIAVPDSDKPKSGTVYKGGVIWSNAFSFTLSDIPLSVSPFAFTRHDSLNYAQHNTIGGSLDATLSDTAERKITGGITVARLSPKLSIAQLNSSSINLTVVQTINPTQKVTFGVKSSHTNLINSNDFDSTNNTITGSFSKDFDLVKVRSDFAFTQRNSKTESLSGKDRSISLKGEMPFGVQSLSEIYAKYSYTESSDNAARPTHSTARDNITNTYEFGYTMPIPVTNFAKLSFYVKASDTNSDLAAFISEETTFGTKFVVSF